MALIDFTTKSGLAVASADIADIVNHLQGASAKTDAWHFRVSSGNNYLITLSDAAGAQKFSVRDSGAVEKFSVDSDGNVTIAGTLTNSGSLVVPVSASPSQTAEGSLVADSDDDMLTLGTGAATKYIGLSRGAGSDASATKELMYDTTNKVLKVWNGSASISAANYAPTRNYKSATQVFTTNTTFADVDGALGATFSFAIAASEVWMAEYWIPLTFGGTGGAKFQLTGPAAPTNVDITGTYIRASTTMTAGGATDKFADVTAFSSSIGAQNSGAQATSDVVYVNTAPGSAIHIKARITNGANAGTVTLQAAQNSSNSTTTLGIGATMRAERIA